MKFVAWFGEVNKDDGAVVGGKGSNLGELTRPGIPVPSGYVVTSEVYFAFLDRPEGNNPDARLCASATKGPSHPDTMVADG